MECGRRRDRDLSPEAEMKLIEEEEEVVVEGSAEQLSLSAERSE